MNVKNIKSFIEFYKFLGITDCVLQYPRIQLPSGLKMKSTSDLNRANKENRKKITSMIEKLDSLKSEIKELDCNLKEVATNLVFSDGNHKSKIMILGEAPGANEDIEGKPFVGDAGKLLDKMLNYIGLNRTNFYISNIVFWRPPGNRTPNEKEISTCLPMTKKHIRLIKPSLLILVGSIAAKSLLSSKDGITKLRGKEHFYVDDDINLKIPARAIFHPAYLFRNPIEKKRTWEDLLEIDEYIKKEGILKNE